WGGGGLPRSRCGWGWGLCAVGDGLAGLVAAARGQKEDYEHRHDCQPTAGGSGPAERRDSNKAADSADEPCGQPVLAPPIGRGSFAARNPEDAHDLADVPLGTIQGDAEFTSDVGIRVAPG